MTAAPQDPEYNQQFVSVSQPQIRIISQKFDQDQYGNYEYAYEQDNGQKVRKLWFYLLPNRAE